MRIIDVNMSVGGRGFYGKTVDLAAQYPNAKFILVRCGLCRGRHVMPLLQKCKNVYFTIENMLDNEQICYSQSYISKAFKKKYGIDVSQYVNQVRIARAKKLIRDGSRNIKEIALQVGYSSDAQFIRVFQKFEAVTPGVFCAENEQSERGSGQCAFSAAAAESPANGASADAAPADDALPFEGVELSL